MRIETRRDGRSQPSEYSRLLHFNCRHPEGRVCVDRSQPAFAAKRNRIPANDSEAKLLVALDALYNKVSSVAGRTKLHTIAVASIADYLPPVKKWLGKLLNKMEISSFLILS